MHVRHPGRSLVARRNNVTVTGRPDGPPIVFAHGFGCDQTVWQRVAPAFAGTHRLVLFDHVGAGGSDLEAYDRDRYGTLHGYAADVLELCHALELDDVTFVGHSVAATIGVLAAIEEPERFASLVLVAPSPSFIDDGEYRGGFSREDIHGLLEALDANYLGWSSAMAPMVMGTPDRPQLGEELTASFCRTDPEIAKHFAGVTFLSDHRADLVRCATRALVLQCADDALAPPVVGEFVHEQLPESRLVHMHATGHCPHISAPAETIAAIGAFL
jgi:sigma-B regulation protein RsbQ